MTFDLSKPRPSIARLWGIALLVSTSAVAGANEPCEVANSIGMRFVRVPAGAYWRGSSDDDPRADADERPRREVRIARAFYLGRYEVTQEEYLAVAGDNPSWFAPQGGGRDDVRGVETSRLPVEFVSWDEAVAFCRRLGDLPVERAAGRRYRLPTEAEWEYAARCGTTTRFAFGDELVATDANVRSADDARPRTTKLVGSYRPNAWGLYDLHGNVWEWCADRYDAEYYATSPTRDPQGPDAGTGRVVRGGDYRFGAAQARCANRDFTRPSRRDWGNGFRVVLEVNAESRRSPADGTQPEIDGR